MATQSTVQLSNGASATMTTKPMLAGDAGVNNTMRDMVRLVRNDVSHPEIVKRARALKKGTPTETARAVFNWMSDNYKYASDGVNEFLTSPWITVQKASPYKPFDCDDMSMLLSALLEANGIETAFKAISWRETVPAHQFSHVYVLAKLEHGWIPLDGVMGRSGFGSERSPIYRSLIIPVSGASRSQGLSDADGATEPDYREVGLEFGRRIFGGENAGDVVKDMATQICKQGVRDELMARRVPLIIAGCTVASGFVALGFMIGKHSAKKRG